MRLNARQGAQSARIDQIHDAARAADQTALTQVAQYARQGFWRNAQLRRNQAFALLQFDRADPFIAGLGVAQKPFGTTCFGVFGKSADRQFNLLAVCTGYVVQYRLRCQAATS